MSHDDPDEKMFHDRAAALALLEGGQCIDGEDDDISVAGASEAAPGDSLDQKRSLRADKWNELNRIARFSRFQPPTVLQGTLGNQQVVMMGQRLPVANWGGEDAESMPVTITFAPSNPTTPNDNGLGILRPFGVVQFGTRGMLVQAEVDIGRGTQFTVGASMVTLQVALEPDQTGLGQDQNTMQLAGMLSFMPIVRTVPVTRTLYSQGVTAPFTQTFPVPNFGKNLIVWRENGTQTVGLNFLDSSGGIVYSFTIAAGVPMLVPVLLAGDITHVQVEVLAPFISDTGLLRLVFGLEF